MNKRDHQEDQVQAPAQSRRSAPSSKLGDASSAEDFARHLEAMFRSELGDEDDELLEPVIRWDAEPAPKTPSKGEDSAELFQAVAEFLSEETGEPAPAKQPARKPQAKASPAELRQADRSARKEAREKARREQEEKARQEREEKARREREEKVRREREEKARQEQEAQARKEREELARQEREEKARQRREERARREREEKARREREEAEARRAQEEAERLAAAQAAEEAAREEARQRERLVFFEPKQKKNSFFEPKAPMGVLPEDPEELRSQEAPPQQEERPRRQEKPRQKTQRRSRREKRSAPPAPRSRAPIPESVPTEPFPAAPAEPSPDPAAATDGALEAFFAPMGLRAAPPDPSPAAVFSPRAASPEEPGSEAEVSARSADSEEKARTPSQHRLTRQEQRAAKREARTREKARRAQGRSRKAPTPQTKPAPAPQAAPKRSSLGAAHSDNDDILAAMAAEIPGLAALLAEAGDQVPASLLEPASMGPETQAPPPEPQAPASTARDSEAAQSALSRENYAGLTLRFEALPSDSAAQADAREADADSPEAAQVLPDRDASPVPTEAAPAPAEEAWSDNWLFDAVNALLDQPGPQAVPETPAQAPAPAEASEPPAQATQRVPELWDPQALFEGPEEAPPVLPPLSRDTTGSLPSLEELFGPSQETQAAEAPAAPAQPRAERRRSKGRGLFHRARPEVPRPARRPVGPAPAEQNPPTLDQPTYAGALPDAPAGEALPERSTLVPEPPAAPIPDTLILEPSAPAAETPATPAAEPGSAGDWDPLSLFGASTPEEELPTWDAFVQSRRAARQEAEAPAEGALPETGQDSPLPDSFQLPETPSADTRPAPEALSLQDFLSAAVPMEELPAPRRREAGRRPRKDAATVSVGSSAPESISTAQENPEGLILTWNGKAQEQAGRRRSSNQGERRNQAASDTPEELFRPRAPQRARRPRQGRGRELAREERSILHPEEAYRVFAKPLDEIGSRLILTGLFTILSLFLTLYLGQGWSFLPGLFSGGATVYILMVMLLIMVLINRRLYFRQWRDSDGLRPELLLVIATVFTLLDCFSAAQSLRPPFTVVVGALLMVELWGLYDRGLGMITTVKVLRGELSAGVSEVQDITKGSRGLVRTEPDVDSFMGRLETRDLTDRVLRVYTPAAALVGLILTLVVSLGLKQDFFWSGALIFLGSVPVTGLLVFPRLFCLLARRLAETQAALCGYHGAEVFGGEHSILIGDDDIFPAGSLTLNGFKVYSGNPDRVIAYAAAAFRSSGSALDPVFEDLLLTHNGRHYSVDNFRFYDSGGIGASILQDVVLLGSLDFMRRMGVHMDRGAKVKQAVYMSLNGELAAVFAVRYAPPENLRRGLAAIAGNKHFKGILVTRTFLGTPGFLKAKFGIPTSAFVYPSTKERIRLSEAEMKRSGAQGAILAKDSFSGFAQAAAGGRMLRSATLGGAALTLVGGLTGLILTGVLAALPAYETATALNLLLYSAAWLVPTLLLTSWARHF